MNRCQLCSHEARAVVDLMLVRGTPPIDVANQYKVSLALVYRHRSSHVHELASRAHDAEVVAGGDALLGEVMLIKDRLEGLLDQAEAAGDFNVAVRAAKEIRECLVVLLEVERRIDRRAVVNVLVMPEWIAVRGALMDALAPYPAARAAVAQCLVALPTHS